jgi:hypothetical protein
MRIFLSSLLFQGFRHYLIFITFFDQAKKVALKEAVFLNG